MKNPLFETVNSSQLIYGFSPVFTNGNSSKKVFAGFCRLFSHSPIPFEQSENASWRSRFMTERKRSRFIVRRRKNEARLRRMKHRRYEAPLRGMKRSLTASFFLPGGQKRAGSDYPWLVKSLY